MGGGLMLAMGLLGMRQRKLSLNSAEQKTPNSR
jgi:hypothetical protein